MITAYQGAALAAAEKLVEAREALIDIRSNIALRKGDEINRLVTDIDNLFAVLVPNDPSKSTERDLS